MKATSHKKCRLLIAEKHSQFFVKFFHCSLVKCYFFDLHKFIKVKGNPPSVILLYAYVSLYFLIVQE